MRQNFIRKNLKGKIAQAKRPTAAIKRKQKNEIKDKADKKSEKTVKFRTQAFEGMVLARKHGAEAGGTFTVRRIASGVGVERIFPLYSPMVDKIEIVKRAKARRSKLYYIRTKAVKDVRRKMRSATFEDEAVEAVKAE